MDLEEFKTQHIRGRHAGKFKVTNSWGVYSAYKAVRKHGWYHIGRPVTEKEFYAVIRGVNLLLAENLANGITVKLPERMGTLELRKWERGVSIVNDKLKIGYPVDWGKTWELWFREPDAFRNKTLLRDESKQAYSVRYLKRDATYENKTFYQFVLNNAIKIKLKENIKNGKTDTLW